MDKRDGFVLWTNDVETTSIWTNSLRDETGRKVVSDGLPALLDLYAKYNITSTFFFTGYIARKFPESVKMVIPGGHEIASHGMSHKPSLAFDKLDLKTQKEHLKESKKILENIGGEKVIAFRAPALRVNSHTAAALAETGYLIDSSVASQRFDAFLSYGSGRKLSWLNAPRKPYRTDPGNLMKKGNGPILEIPLSAFIFPYLGTTMRIFPRFTRLVRHYLGNESLKTGKPVVFDIHPNEIIDESHDKRRIQRRSKNIFTYLLSDLFRSELKIRNLGNPALDFFENEIRYFHTRGFQTTTLSNYRDILDK